MVIEAISVAAVPTEKPCEKCGLYPHSIAAMRDLPAELQAEFPVLDRHAAPSEPVKRRRLCLEGRVISNEQLVEQLKAKGSGSKPCIKSRKVDKSLKLSCFVITTYRK